MSIFLRTLQIFTWNVRKIAERKDEAPHAVVWFKWRQDKHAAHGFHVRRQLLDTMDDVNGYTCA